MRELRTREDVALLLLDWIRPLMAHYSAGGALLKVGNTSAHYGETSIRMEGYSRVLWGLGPLFAGADVPMGALKHMLLGNLGGHFRVHYVKTRIPVRLADGGFAVRLEQGMTRSDASMIRTGAHEICCDFWSIIFTGTRRSWQNPRRFRSFRRMKREDGYESLR